MFKPHESIISAYAIIRRIFKRRWPIGTNTFHRNHLFNTILKLNLIWRNLDMLFSSHVNTSSQTAFLITSRMVSEYDRKSLELKFCNSERIISSTCVKCFNQITEKGYIAYLNKLRAHFEDYVALENLFEHLNKLINFLIFIMKFCEFDIIIVKDVLQYDLYEKHRSDDMLQQKTLFYYSKILVDNDYFTLRKNQNLILLFFGVLKEGDFSTQKQLNMKSYLYFSIHFTKLFKNIFWVS
ncbi:hypothetical protein E2986_12010 [Frieseomelitta varia]|uniref:Uncharacterized protein n=1 Tax=Frieseomelitta varia TaxID=561572 RepID=A0A833VTW5_9HYME|nr:hypothetical protein E2986_12010 [Frieseomelitta varia]